MKNGWVLLIISIVCGFISPIITRVWKYYYKFYATANMTGGYTTGYEFKCQM